MAYIQGVIDIFVIFIAVSIMYCLKAEIFKPNPFFIQRHICISKRYKEMTSINKACDHLWSVEDVNFSPIMKLWSTMGAERAMSVQN